MIRNDRRMTWHRGRAAFAAAVLLVMAAPAWAQPHTERPEQILDEVRSHAELRAAMLAYADSVVDTERGNASLAYGYAAQSHAQHSQLDSAIVYFEKAYASQPATDQAVALIDALMRREDRGDMERARAVLRSKLAGIPRGRYDRQPLEAREMWMLHVEGHADSAGMVLRGLLRDFEFDDTWAYRAGVVATAIPDPSLAAGFLVDLAGRSRMNDEAVMEALVEAVSLLGHDANSAVGALQRSIATWMDVTATAIEPFGGAPVEFRGSDGFALGGAVFTPLRTSQRAAILVMGAGDTLAVYDSLVTPLRREGYAVLVLSRRGDPMSSDAACPLPGAWRGREVELERRMALDVQDALRMLASVYPVDTTRYLVGGMRESAGIALLAAELDPRARAILLASTEPPRVQRGILLGRAESLQRPMFLQIAPEDLVDLYYYTDALYQAGEHKYSRVSESKAQGRGAETFRNDSRNTLRLRQWLNSLDPVFEAD